MCSERACLGATQLRTATTPDKYDGRCRFSRRKRFRLRDARSDGAGRRPVGRRQRRWRRAATERSALGEIGHRLGRKVLAEIATIARPDTILGWYRKLVAHKFDGSARRGPRSMS